MKNTRGAVGGGGCGSVDFGDIRVRVCEIESISYLIFFLIHAFHLVVDKALPILDRATTDDIMATATATATTEVLTCVPVQR